MAALTSLIPRPPTEYLASPFQSSSYALLWPILVHNVFSGRREDGWRQKLGIFSSHLMLKIVFEGWHSKPFFTPYSSSELQTWISNYLLNIHTLIFHWGLNPTWLQCNQHFPPNLLFLIIYMSIKDASSYNYISQKLFFHI